MNFLVNTMPMLALFLAQFSEADAKLSVYGPIGIICAWLIWRDERTQRAAHRMHLDNLKENEKTRESIGGVAHQMKGMNRNLLYVTATHGPVGLREVAQRELDRTA